MKTAIPAAFVLALSASTVSAAAVPDQGRKGAWTWSQNIAKTEIGSGVQLMVVFSDEESCDLAMLIVGGNRNITELGLTVDGQFYGYTDMTLAPDTEITGVPLGPSVLKGIKHGNSAKVTTNVGSAPLSLSGSAKAINSAYGNCMQRTKPIIAAAPMPQPRSASESRGSERNQFVGKRVRADGTEMLAVHNVVFVFGNIQIGDDVLLQELVRDMENAGVPFKSVS